VKYWLRFEGDWDVAVSWKVDHLKRYPPKKPLVVLVGGSGANAGISSNSELSSAISKALGQQILAYVLGSGRQTIAASMAIIDNLPDTNTTVLIGVNLNRFTNDRQSSFAQVSGRGLLLQSARLRHYVSVTYGDEYPPFGILPGILSYLKGEIIQISVRIMSGNSPFLNLDSDLRQDYIRPAYTISEMRQTLQRVFNDRITKFQKNFIFHALMLKEAVRLGKERGLDIVILELPSNREIMGDVFNAQTQQYQALCRVIAAEYNIPYLNFNDQLSLGSTDFMDLDHMNEKGRAIWENKLVERLATLYLTGAIGKGKF
jgi:hypothetical protein